MRLPDSQDQTAIAPAQAPAAPLPPAAPQPPGTPIAISTPGSMIGVPTAPRTAAEVRGLRERREELRDQLERAANRRAEVVRSMDQEDEAPLSNAARAGLQERINVIDQRIIQIERDQALTEQLIASAPPAVLATEAFEMRAESGRMDEDEAIGMGFSMFGLGIVLTLLVSRFRRRRALKKGVGVAPIASAVSEERFEQLVTSIGAMADEVERIGEGQRFLTQLMARQPDAQALRSVPEQR